MDTKRTRTSIIAAAVAAAIALSGTFAWQNYNQQALNEAKSAANPGGRLHDDFSGYNTASVTGTTKDVYVENFGSQVIYARVRLDEYMELGTGAGEADGTEGKTATPLVSTASIGDPATWTTHIPGADDAAAADDEKADPFHTYWTWTMGGSTVYMPTFNKNQDSLSADVNGTMDGTDPDDDIYYDDFVAYAAGDAVTATAYYDADDNTTDEYEKGVSDAPGAGGTQGTNFTAVEETHAAANTLTAEVITMAAYHNLTDDEKTALNAWVYDADGWAYWSQGIQPETATGLLLDGITLSTTPSQAWYYAINAVAQFITADDLGKADSTGFYDANAGTAPTSDALALLSYIGVDTTDGASEEPESAVTVALAGETEDSAAVTAVRANSTTTFSAKATDAEGNDVTDAAYSWTAGDENGDAIEGVSLAAATSGYSAAEAVTGQKVTLTVGSGVAADAKIYVKCVVTVSEKEYTQTHLVTVTENPVYAVTVKAADDAASVAQNGTLAFTATATEDGVAMETQPNITWSATDASNGAIDGVSITDGALSVESSVDAGTEITVTATATINETEVSGTVTVTVKAVSSVTVTAAGTVNVGESVTLTPTITYSDNTTSNDPSLLTWQITTEGTNSGTSVSDAGVLTVSADETLTNISVKVTSKESSEVNGSCDVTILTASE